MARFIDHHDPPSLQSINVARSDADLGDNETNVAIETGVLAWETIDDVHGLRVVDVQQHTINLTWTEFIPIDYEGEYVLAVSSSRSISESGWDYKDIGRQANYTLKNLKADTKYMLRIAIRGGGVSRNLSAGEVFRNMSGIIITRTLPVPQCVYRHVAYPVNRYFVYEEEDVCRCAGTGDLICDSLTRFANPMIDAMNAAQRASALELHGGEL